MYYYDIIPIFVQKNKITMSDLATLVRLLCREAGMMMKDVADEIGISPVTLSQNIKKNSPRQKTFENLERAFHVKAVDIAKMYYNPEDYAVSRFSSEPDEKGRYRIAITPKSFNAPFPEDSIFTYNDVTGVFGFRGKRFYAYSLDEARMILDVLESITKMDNDVQAKATLELLIKQCGTLRD